MSSRRTLILIAAIAIGGLAAFLTLNYVRGVENETAEQNQLVDVLVAAGPVAKGQSADSAIAAGQIGIDKRRRADLPSSAITRHADIQGQVAAVGLGGGEVITSQMFAAETDLSGSKSTSIDKGNVAVTITVGEAAGVAGLIQPGDSVNIMAQVSPPDADFIVDEGGAFVPPNRSIYAFQNVKVLAVGTNLGIPVASTSPEAEGEGEAPPPEPVSSGLITVQLPPAEALQLASMRDAGLYLTLNRSDYTEIPSPHTEQIPIYSGIAGVSPYAQTTEDNGQ